MVKSQKRGKNTKLKKMIKVSKYEFDSEEQALSKINALPSVKDDDGNDVHFVAINYEVEQNKLSFQDFQ